MSDSIDEISDLVTDYCRERGWDRSNSSRSLAISLLLEASELLEHYQWSETSSGSADELADEIADIVIYVIQFAAKNQIDVLQAVREKITKTRSKYPAELFDVEDEQERGRRWRQAKAAYGHDL